MYRIGKFALEELLPVTKIGKANVRAVLRAAADKGYSESVLHHLRVDLSSVFKDLVEDAVLTTNPAREAQLPENDRPSDDRERARLTDAEFESFMLGAGENPESISGELVMMCIASRCIGCARTSDLLALDWRQIDWQARTIRLERQKTRRKGVRWQTLELPRDAEEFLRVWHKIENSPTEGAILPVRKGPRAGQRREGKFSYAEDLRQALRLAWGID